MTAFMAQMLDELMGTGRNSVDGASKVSFENPEVCKFALAGFCPREASRNTKMDFGQCAQVRHDECFKEEYKRSSRFGKLGYEEQFMRRIREINREIQRKIDKNTDRLNSGCLPGVEGVTTEYDEQLANLTRQIDENMNKGQLMCEAGQVTEGQELLKEAEELQVEAARNGCDSGSPWQSRLRPSTWPQAPSLEKSQPEAQLQPFATPSMRPKFMPGRNRAGLVIASHPPPVQIVQVAECAAGNVELLTPFILPLQAAAEPPLTLPTAFPSTVDAEVMPIQIELIELIDVIDSSQAARPPIADAVFSEESLAMACEQQPTSSFPPFQRVQEPMIEMRSFSGEPLHASTGSVPMFFGADDDSREISYLPLPSQADLHFATVAAGPIYFDAHAHLDLFNSTGHGRGKKMKFASVAQLDQMFKRIPPNFGGLFWNLVMPSHMVPRWRWVLDLLKDRKIIGTTVGIHPRSADQLDRKYDQGQHIATMRQFIQMLLNDKKQYKYLGSAYPVYLHCAQQKPRRIKAWMELSGCLFGIGPCFLDDTPEARDVIKMIPLSRMLVETDAPFFDAHTKSVYELTDAGRRQLSGTATHPAACALLNEYVAKIKGLTYAQVAYATRTATLRFYNLDADYQHLIEEQKSEF
ncbi:unnamed protein product, partial [Mesorhabditis spiculigera]